MRSRFRRRGGRSDAGDGIDAPASASLATLPLSERDTVQLCHPDWRGVRTSAYAFGDPVIEAAVLTAGLAEEIAEAGSRCVVVHASPNGTETFLTTAARLGLDTRQVFHSSMAQHGTDAGEAEAMVDAFALQDRGVLGRIGVVKSGLSEAFAALGREVLHVPNRTPRIPDFEKVDLGAGLNVGVFHDPYWRKNQTTQLAAVAILGGRAHVMARPEVGYLDGLDTVVHGVVPWNRFIVLQGSVDLNLYVTLSESHPMSPMESYLAGVPCLVSRTSELFLDDPDLRDLTTVDRTDDPSEIARVSSHLLDNRSEAVGAAFAWMERHDADAAERWSRFTA